MESESCVDDKNKPVSPANENDTESTITPGKIKPTSFASDFALNHQALIEYSQRELRRLFENDSLLRDLPFDVTNDEVAAQVSCFLLILFFY